MILDRCLCFPVDVDASGWTWGGRACRRGGCVWLLREWGMVCFGRRRGRVCTVLLWYSEAQEGGLLSSSSTTARRQCSVRGGQKERDARAGETRGGSQIRWVCTWCDYTYLLYNGVVAVAAQSRECEVVSALNGITFTCAEFKTVPSRKLWRPHLSRRGSAWEELE